MTVLRSFLLGLGLALASPTLAQDAPDAADLLPLEAETRAPSIEALQATVYDLTALYHAAQQEHWNIVGIEFYQLHDFYGHLYGELEPHLDAIAERQRALGEATDGRPSAVAAGAITAEPEPAPRDAVTTLTFLSDQWQLESDALYGRIDAVEEDLVTQDLLIAVATTIDKQLWMLRAHLVEDGAE